MHVLSLQYTVFTLKQVNFVQWALVTDDMHKKIYHQSQLHSLHIVLQSLLQMLLNNKHKTSGEDSNDHHLETLAPKGQGGAGWFRFQGVFCRNQILSKRFEFC